MVRICLGLQEARKILVEMKTEIIRDPFYQRQNPFTRGQKAALNEAISRLSDTIRKLQ